MRHSNGKSSSGEAPRHPPSPVEGITEKGDKDSQENQEKTAIEGTPTKFKLSPNSARHFNIKREIIQVIIAVNTEISKTQVTSLQSAYGHLLGFALELIIENAKLTARMAF